MKQKKSFDKDNWLLIIYLIITVFLAGITFLLYKLNADNIYQILILSTTFLSAGILIPQLEKVFSRKKMKMAVSCEFHNDLDAMGVIKVYPKRKDSGDEGYLRDLLDDFSGKNKLRKWHKEKNEPIKILGITLGTYFLKSSGFGEKIRLNCHDINFRLIFCKEENGELKFRKNFVDEKFAELEKDNKKWKYEDFNDTPLSSEFKETKIEIDQLSKDIKGGILEYRQYDNFSPFATIFIINDHIYYTPNMLDYSNYLNPNQLSDKSKNIIYEAELSFLIRKESEYGKRLEELFDSLWKSLSKNACDNQKPKPRFALLKKK